MVATGPSPRTEFQDVVSSLDELRALVGMPGEGAIRKDIARIDEHARGFIERSPFALMGTCGASGRCDVTPRGDRPGFALVLDERTLVIPERPGNRRFDSLGNIIENPHVGLLFLVPGWEDTLRVNGSARIIRDAGVLQRCAVDGKTPLYATAVHVEECYIHCPKAFRRSEIWQTESWPDRTSFPSVAQIAKDQLCLLESVENLEAGMNVANKRLW
jgi:uncharacterized protein